MSSTVYNMFIQYKQNTEMPVSPGRPSLHSDGLMQQVTEQLADVRMHVAQERKERVGALGSWEATMQQRQKASAVQMTQVLAKVDSLELVVSRMQTNMNQLADNQSLRPPMETPLLPGPLSHQPVIAANINDEMQAMRRDIQLLMHRSEQPPPQLEEHSHHIKSATAALSNQTLEHFFSQSKTFMDEVETQMRHMKDVIKNDKTRVEQQIVALSSTIEREITESRHQQQQLQGENGPSALDLLLLVLGNPQIASDQNDQLFMKAQEVCAAIGEAVTQQLDSAISTTKKEQENRSQQILQSVESDLESLHNVIKQVEQNNLSGPLDGRVRAIEETIQHKIQFDVQSFDSRIRALEESTCQKQETIPAHNKLVSEAQALEQRIRLLEESFHQKSDVAPIQSLEHRVRGIEESVSQKIHNDSQNIDSRIRLLEENVQQKLHHENTSTDTRLRNVEDSITRKLESTVLKELDNTASAITTSYRDLVDSVELQLGKQINSNTEAVATIESALQRANQKVNQITESITAEQETTSEVINRISLHEQTIQQQLSETNKFAESQHQILVQEISHKLDSIDGKMERELTELASQIATLEVRRQEDVSNRLSQIDSKLERELTEVSAKINTSHMTSVDFEKRFSERGRKIDDYVGQLDDGLREVERVVTSLQYHVSSQQSEVASQPPQVQKQTLRGRSETFPQREDIRTIPDSNFQSPDQLRSASGGVSSPTKVSTGDDTIRRYCDRRFNEMTARIQECEETTRKNVDSRIEQTITRLHDSEDSFKRRFDSMEQDIDSKATQIIKLNDQCTSLNNDITTATGKLQRTLDDEISAVTRSTDNKINDATEKARNSERSAEDTRSKVEREVAEQKSALDRFNKNTKSFEEGVNNSLASLKSEIRDVSLTSKESEAQQTRLVETKTSALNEQVDNFHKTTAVESARLTALRATVEDLTASNDSIKKLVDDIAAKSKTTEQEVFIPTQKIDSMSRNLSSLEQSLVEVRRDISDVSNGVSKLTDDNLTERISAAENYIVEHGTGIALLTNQQSLLENQNNEIAEEITSLDASQRLSAIEQAIIDQTELLTNVVSSESHEQGRKQIDERVTEIEDLIVKQSHDLLKMGESTLTHNNFESFRGEDGSRFADIEEMLIEQEKKIMNISTAAEEMEDLVIQHATELSVTVSAVDDIETSIVTLSNDCSTRLGTLATTTQDFFNKTNSRIDELQQFTVDSDKNAVSKLMSAESRMERLNRETHHTEESFTKRLADLESQYKQDLILSEQKVEQRVTEELHQQELALRSELADLQFESRNASDGRLASQEKIDEIQKRLSELAVKRAQSESRQPSLHTRRSETRVPLPQRIEAATNPMSPARAQSPRTPVSVRSNFSFGSSAASPKSLAERVKEAVSSAQKPSVSSAQKPSVTSGRIDSSKSIGKVPSSPLSERIAAATRKSNRHSDRRHRHRKQRDCQKSCLQLLRLPK